MVAERLTAAVDGLSSYIPGKFYLRELPFIIELLRYIEHPLECIVVDGYVTLGADEYPGVGMRLWQHLRGKVPVIGVAKTKFVGTPKTQKFCVVEVRSHCLLLLSESIWSRRRAIL